MSPHIVPNRNSEMVQNPFAPGPTGPPAGPAEPLTGLKRPPEHATIPFCGNHAPIFVVLFIQKKQAKPIPGRLTLMRSFVDTLGQVYRAIMANKLRSFLTMFGIAWGVGSLLVLVGLGEGFREGQRKQLSQFGHDVVMCFNGTIPALPNQHTGMRPYEFTLGDEAAMRQLPEIRAITGELARSDLYEVSQWSNTSAHLSGNEPSYTVVRNLPIAFGRFLDDEDVRQARRVVFIGQKSASILFQGRPMIGQTITINGINFIVIGVGEKVGRGNNTYDDEKMYIPVTTMQELFPLKGDNIPQDALTTIQYNPTKKNDNTAADIAWHRVIAQRHGFDPSLADAFNEFDTITEANTIGIIFTAMDIFLGSVGVVTLGLGAVGIINIMLVSVTERTREIGVLKAIGATRRSILAQFFWEGLLLTAISGLIGIAVSWGIMALLQSALTDKMPGFDPPRMVPWSAALALVSLTLCGIAAGLYPANKAAALDPIEALRRE
jgi:putative ABC transport system permease protein